MHALILENASLTRQSSKLKANSTEVRLNLGEHNVAAVADLGESCALENESGFKGIASNICSF